MNVKRYSGNDDSFAAYSEQIRNLYGETALVGKDTLRLLSKVADLVPQGSPVTIEGTPLYFGKPWEGNHEFGNNRILPALRYMMEQRSCSVGHYALLDDFTTGQSGDPGYFVGRMLDKPTTIFYESSFQQEAEGVVGNLVSSGKTIFVNGELLLSSYGNPRVRTKSGRVSCEALDACFQRQKVGVYHIIVHPNYFVGQQEGMRAVLRASNGGGLPGHFINVFFKNSSVSRIYASDTSGSVRRVL